MITKKEAVIEAIQSYFELILGDKIGWGRCVEAALIIQDYLKGKIVFFDHKIFGHHYWNVLPDGEKLDLTNGQFPAGTFVCEKDKDRVIRRGRLLSRETTLERYRLMKKFVDEYIANLYPEFKAV